VQAVDQAERKSKLHLLPFISLLNRCI